MQKQFDFGEPNITVKQAGNPDGYAGLYGFHKYWGKKPHEPIAYAIQQLTEPNDLVVDPFLGSGSSSRESIIRNRRFIGFDVNPVATQITKLITAPPDRDNVRRAFLELEIKVKAKIDDSYRLANGKIATHFLWNADELQQVWIKGSAKVSRQEMEPSKHDFRLIRSFDGYGSKLIKSPRFFANGRINAAPEMTLDSLLTHRAQRNIDILLEAILECSSDVRRTLQLCLTAASGQMTKMVFAVSGRGKTTGKAAEKVEVGSWVIGYWRPQVHFEVNVWNCFENRVKRLLSALKKTGDSDIVDFAKRPQDVINDSKKCFVGISDCRKGLAKLPDGCCSLLITDPPHSDRVPYLELSAFWNSILGTDACFEDEIVISNAKDRCKNEQEYHASMSQFLSQATRLLADNGNLVLFFNAKETEAWTSIRRFVDSHNQTGLNFAGKFPCNYSASSVVQDNRKGAMKHDWALVFSRIASRRSKDKHRLSEIPGWSNELPALLT